MESIDEITHLSNDPNVKKLFALLGYNSTQVMKVSGEVSDNGTINSSVPSSIIQRGVVCETKYGRVIVKSKPWSPYGIFRKIECVEVAPLLNSTFTGTEFLIVDNKYFIPKRNTWTILESDISSISGYLENTKGLSVKHVGIDFNDAVYELSKLHMERAKTLYEALVLIIQLTSNYTKHGAQTLIKYFNSGDWKKFIYNRVSLRDFHVWNDGHYGLPAGITQPEQEDIENFVNPPEKITYTTEVENLKLRGIRIIRDASYEELCMWVNKSKAPGLMRLIDIFKSES